MSWLVLCLSILYAVFVYWLVLFAGTQWRKRFAARMRRHYGAITYSVGLLALVFAPLLLISGLAQGNAWLNGTCLGSTHQE